MLQFSKEGKCSSFCSFCTCFSRAICEVTAVRWLLVEMRSGITEHLFNCLGSVYTRAAWTVNSHGCTLHPTRVTHVLGFGRKPFLEHRSFSVLVEDRRLIEELLRILPFYLICGSLPALNPFSVTSCLLPLLLCTCMGWHFVSWGWH